jgi:hypothetical protein
MRVTTRIMFIIVVAFSTIAPAVGKEKPQVALVRARVKSVAATKDERKPATAVLEVIHVYTGPAEWKGRTFVDTQRAQSANGGEALSPFAVDEEGLWVLSVGERDELWLTSDDRFLFSRRSRKGDTTRHAEHLKMAEAVEKVEKEKPEKRLTMLREFATDKTTEVACWAVAAVGRLDTTDARKYLDELAAKPDPKLSVAAQISLDEVLCQRPDSDWPDSKPRTAMLRGWVNAAQTAEVAGRVQSRLDLGHQKKELGDKLAVELLATAAGNAEWPMAARRYALEQVWRAADRAASDDARAAAWECVFGHMQKNDDLELRRWAAEVAGLFPLYTARLKAIEEHLATEKDEKVAASLRAAVKKANEKK